MRKEEFVAAYSNKAYEKADNMFVFQGSFSYDTNKLPYATMIERLQSIKPETVLKAGFKIVNNPQKFPLNEVEWECVVPKPGKKVDDEDIKLNYRIQIREYKPDHSLFRNCNVQNSPVVEENKTDDVAIPIETGIANCPSLLWKFRVDQKTFIAIFYTALNN